MKVLFQPTDVIFVWVAQQECIYIEPIEAIALQPPAEIRDHVWRIVVRVVCSRSDMEVDQDRLIIVQLNQSHVPVSNGEEGYGRSHQVLRSRGRIW